MVLVLIIDWGRNVCVRKKVKSFFPNFFHFRLLWLFIPNEAFGGQHAHSRAGVGNSFDSAGHIRDKLGIRGPVRLLLGKNKYKKPKRNMIFKLILC